MNMEYKEVRTKSELESAVKNKVNKIVIKGELAEKINKAEVVKNVSKPALLVLGAALAATAATPFTGGLSGVVGVASIAGISATTGMSIVAIMSVSFLGLALIMTITDGYDRKFTAKAEGYGEATMELKKKENK